jgi:hypothetical protein
MKYSSLKKIITDYYLEKISKDELIKHINNWQKVNYLSPKGRSFLVNEDKKKENENVHKIYNN